MSASRDPRVWSIERHFTGSTLATGPELFVHVPVRVVETAPVVELLEHLNTTCREWEPGKADRCNAPAEFLLWGKLIDTEGLGPRCYDCAAKHVGHRMLGDRCAAIVDLRPFRTLLSQLTTTEREGR